MIVKERDFVALEVSSEARIYSMIEVSIERKEKLVNGLVVVTKDKLQID